MSASGLPEAASALRPLLELLADLLAPAIASRLAASAPPERRVVRAADRPCRLSPRAFRDAGRAGHFKTWLAGRGEVCAYEDDVRAWVESRKPRRKPRPTPALPPTAPANDARAADIELLRRAGAIGPARPARKAAG